MKIAIWYNLPSGGSKRALYYHVRGLVQRGHHVEIWQPPTADTNFLPLEDFAKTHTLPIAWQDGVQKGKLAKLLACNRDIPGRIAALDPHCRQCAEEINNGGFDLFFANPCKYMGAAPIGRYIKIPKVIYLQEPCRLMYEARSHPVWAALPPLVGGGPKAWLKRKIDEFTDAQKNRDRRLHVREEYRNAQAFDTILVNSLFSRESIWRAYGLDSRVCYLGIDTDLFQYQRKERDNFILGVGALQGAKNVELIIEAIGQIPTPRPRLIWVGNAGYPDYITYLKVLAEQKQVPFEMQVLVSDQALVDMLNRAALMAYAPRLEPFGFAPLEANSCGTPVVTVAEGGVRETITDGVNGLVVEHTPRDMADAIMRLLRNRDFARKLGENGQQIVQERWSLESSVDRLEQRLEERLSDGARQLVTA